MFALIEQAFDIRPDERRLVWLFFVFFVGVGMFYTVGSTVGDTLFLSNLTSEQVPRRLPWVYIGIAVANVVSTIVFDAVQARVSRTNCIVGTQIVLAASVFLARQGIEAHSDALYLALVIWLEAVALISITLFFSFAGDYFDARNARRLYGFIAGGMALGTVVSGYAIHLSVGLIGTKNLLYVGGTILLCNAALAAVIFHVGKPVTVDALDERKPESEQVHLRSIIARPYVRLLMLMVPLSVVSYVTVDYQMKWIASAKSEEELARFFGQFFGWVGVAQVTFQFLVAQRLLQRLGIITCLMIVPLSLGIASAALYSGSFFGFFGMSLLMLSAGVNSLRMTLAETLDLPSRELLFLPLPSRIRVRLQPLLSGAWAPAAQGVGALLMLAALQFHVRVETLSLITIACAGALLITLVRLRPKYRETLADALRDHQLDATDLEQVLQSPGADALLEGMLHSSDREVLRATIDLLGRRSVGNVSARLEELVQGDDDEIAVAALQRLAASKDPRLMAAVQHGWSSPYLPVRQAAVLALCEASGEAAIEQLSMALSSDDATLRTSAVIGLARHCGDSGQALVRPGLAAAVTSADAFERMEAVALLGRIASPGFADLFSTLLKDPLRDVRLAAADACASVGDPLLIGPLLKGMAEPEMRSACMRALGAMPDSVTPQLTLLLDETNWPLSERCAMARVLGRIASKPAAQALWDHVHEPHPLTLRLAVADSLRSMRARGALPALDYVDYDGVIEQICARCVLLNEAISQLGNGDAFVAGIFSDHARMQIELLCAILALRYDQRAVERVRYNLFSESRDVGIRALELFDEMLPGRIAQPVVSMLQTWLEAPNTQSSQLSPDCMQRLIDAEPWLRVATIYHANQGAAYPIILAASLSDADRELYRLLDLVCFLKRVPLLRELAALYLLEQAEIAQWQVLATGEVLFQQGDAGDALFIIGQGEIEVRVDDHAVAKLQAGECIGDLALLDGEPRSATAVARVETSLLRVASDRFRNLIATQPAAARALLQTIEHRIRDVQGGQVAVTPQMRRSQLMRAQKLDLLQLVSTMSFLRQVELFRDLSTSALANLAGIAEQITLYEGDTLFEQGDPGESLYLVSSGSIAIVVDERQVATLERNACLGEMALLSGLPRSATAWAITESRLLRIGSDDFMNLLAAEPEIVLALLRTLAQRLRAALTSQAEKAREQPN